MKFITKLFAILLFGIILPFSISQAQSSENTNPLQSGSKALQFQISDNFNLDSFSGTTFSYKRQLEKNRAKRIGLSLNNRYNWRNSPDNNQEALDLNVGLNYTWINYTNPESDIKFYYGYGPGINLGFDRTVQELPGLKDTDQETFYRISGVGYAGVEWFFQSSMSLHAEYQASIQVNHRREKNTLELNDSFDSNDNEEVNKSNSTSISLGGDGVRFGVSVYFQN